MDIDRWPENLYWINERQQSQIRSSLATLIETFHISLGAKKTPPLRSNMAIKVIWGSTPRGKVHSSNSNKKFNHNQVNKQSSLNFSMLQKSCKATRFLFMAPNWTQSLLTTLLNETRLTKTAVEWVKCFLLHQRKSCLRPLLEGHRLIDLAAEIHNRKLKVQVLIS